MYDTIDGKKASILSDTNTTYSNGADLIYIHPIDPKEPVIIVSPIYSPASR